MSAFRLSDDGVKCGFLMRLPCLDEVVICLDALSEPQLIDLEAIIAYSRTLSDDQFKLFIGQVIWRNQPAEENIGPFTGWEFVQGWIELKLRLPDFGSAD